MRRSYRTGQSAQIRSLLQSPVNLARKATTLLALSIIVITYLLTLTTIFILCDNDNHHAPTTTLPNSASDVNQREFKGTTTTTTSATDRDNKLKPLSHQRLKHKDGKDDTDFQFIGRGDLYFLISEPETLRYTFKAKSSRIGIPFTDTLSNIALVLAEPRSACTSTINKLEIRKNIALVERGGCSFLEKCIEVERSGGAALIVYDYDKLNEQTYFEMIDDHTSRNCSIPAVFLPGKDGYMIVHSLLALKLNRAVITIPISVSKDEVSNPPWSTY